jgi:signal transduction histidine kinase
MTAMTATTLPAGALLAIARAASAEEAGACAARAALSLTGGDIAALVSIDANGSVALRAHAGDVAARATLLEPSLPRRAATAQHALVEDATAHSQHSGVPPAWRAAAPCGSTHADAMVLLIAGRGTAPGPDILDALDTIAATAGLALDRFAPRDRPDHSPRRADEFAGAVLAIITAASPSEALETAARHACAILGGRRGAAHEDHGSDAGAMGATSRSPIPTADDRRLSAPVLSSAGERLGVITVEGVPEGRAEAGAQVLRHLATVAGGVIEQRERQRTEALAAATAEAERLKGDLLSTVSHELRTPLAAIKGFTTTLLLYYRRLSREERVSFLQEIDDASDRLTELVDNLLQLSRLVAGTPRIERAPVALSGVLAAAVEEARRRYPTREIGCSASDDLPIVSADHRRIQQVAGNLIENAVKFSPEGGPVQVMAARAPDGSARFSVTDRGIGIAPAHQARVFERFYRAPNPRAVEIGGTGLGLAIVQRIVEQHGGRIDLQSEEGAGTTFTVTLPPLETPSTFA